MKQDTQMVLPFSKVSGKKVEADFDGGNITSDGGILFLQSIESKLKLIDRFVDSLEDNRHQGYIRHTYSEMLRQRIFQIACGYEDANDCDDLRSDPAIKTACGRLPESAEDLASQPTMTRLENSVDRRMLYNTAYALVDAYIASYATAPESIILDIDDTDDATHGAQQLTLFNAYYDEHCYMPLHIYEGQSGKLITALLRPGKRPSGKEIVSIIKRLVAHIRKSWPQVKIILRGDGHFSAPEVHDFCEAEGLWFVLGQSGNKKLCGLVSGLLEQARDLYKEKGEKIKLFRFLDYQASSWSKAQRLVCKVEVSDAGENIRFVVSNIPHGQASVIYSTMYCGRGQMENFIKNHKTYLQSDRTSCHSFKANQFRLFLHSAAYILLHTLESTALKGTQYVKAQFDTIQKRILKVGARVRELSKKIVFHFPTSFPLKEVFLKMNRNMALEFR